VAASGGSIHEFRKTTRKMRNWYEALADYMIVHPTATQDEMARHFGRAVATISTVVNTDAFKMYFNKRRTQHADSLDATVRQKLFKLADASLDHMLSALEKKRDTVPLETLQRTSDMALKNLGYGVTPPSGVNVNVNTQPATVNVAVSVEDLEKAREALRRNQMAPAIEAEYTEIEAAPEEARLARGGTIPPDPEAAE